MSQAEPELHIVSIDDEPNIRKLIASILSPAYRVSAFADAESALGALKELEPDLIICDIDMPGLDGLGLHQELREEPSLRALPFIFLTGLASREHFRQGMRQGADDYLTKPFTSGELLEAVKVRLERSSQLRTEAEAADPKLTVTSLGGAGLNANGDYLKYEAKKVIELLLYLLTRKHPAQLRGLRGDLWRKPVGENNVHVLIGRARKTYAGVAEFKVDGDDLSVNLLVPLSWDALTFEKSAEAALSSGAYGDLERAIGLYQGAFLPGFDSPWASAQRDYYESLYLDLLERSLGNAPNEAARESAETRLASFLEGD